MADDARPAHWRTEKKRKVKKPSPVADDEATATAKSESSKPVINLMMSAQEKEKRAIPQTQLITMLRVPKELLEHLGRYYAILLRPNQLATVEAVTTLFGKNQEFAICPMFAPDFVEACAQQGVFPMSTRAFPGNNSAFFAAKLHVQRSVSKIGPEMTLPKGLTKTSKHHSVVLNCYWNEVTAMIHKQHGEDWLCKALRAIFCHMFDTRTLKTKLFSIAILDNALLPELTAAEAQYRALLEQGETPSEEIESHLQDLRSRCVVAGELGYTVGDIYTSLTGAFNGDGCGSLQLGMTGMLLHRFGYHSWDLGMSMKYKVEALGTEDIPRKRWLSFVQQHRTVVPSSDKYKGALIPAASELPKEPGLAEAAGVVFSCQDVLMWFRGLTAAQQAQAA